MSKSMADRLADVHPQMLRVESESRRDVGEGDRKKLADLRPAIGRLVERALEIAGIEKQEAAHDMGYRDPGTVSRWCSGLERPHFDKLFALEGFEAAYVIALAERNPRRMQVQTTVTILGLERPA